MPPRQVDPLHILSLKCQVWWKTEQQWKLGKVISYDKTRNCYTIEYNGGFKEIDLVVVKHKEEDGMVQITKSYLLRYDPRDHTAKERRSQRTQFHPTFPIEKCGMCQMCKNPQMKQSCLFMRTAQIAHKRVYSAMVALERSRAIAKRIGVFWPTEKKWFVGTLVDFDPYTWRHQIMYDSGEIQDIRLVTEQIRHTRDDERDFSRAKWWDSATMDTLPSLAGMFRSRANGPALVGKEVMVWNTTLPLKERWQKCHVVSWEPEPKSRHVVVTIEDEETINIDYTRHAIFVPDHELCQKLLKEEEERDIQATEQATGRSRRELWETGETWERDLKRARVEGRGAAPGGSHEINPLMDIYQEAPYEQVMQWFQEFLQYDDRTPAEVRSLLALHFSARDRQLLAGMDADTTGGRERFFGVPLRRFGALTDAELEDVGAVSDALMGGSRDLHVGWSSCQALVNLMFRPSQSYRRDIEAAAKPQGNPLLAAIPDLPVTGMEGPGDAEPPAGPSAMPVPPAMGRSHAQQASRSGRQ